MIQTGSDGRMGETRILETGKDGGQTELTLKNFERKYEVYKQALINQADTFEGSIQADLKETIVEVMSLKSQILKDIALLEQKGISA